MNTYFITLRPTQKSDYKSIRQVVRPIKRATHPCPTAANMHLHNSLEEFDPHIHLTVATDNLDALTDSLRRFLPNWRMQYANIARNPKATVLYASSKLDADPIFFRPGLAELS